MTHRILLMLSQLADPPEISPLGVVLRWLGVVGSVALLVVLDDFGVFFGLLFVLRGGTDLVVGLWEDILGFVLVVEFASTIEELLHLVNEHIVVFLVDSWVFDDETTELMQGVCHLRAVAMRAVLLFEVGLDVDHWHCLGEQPSDLSDQHSQ
jgi:hypothetical protein